jgi:hypothetical protein
MLPSSYRFCRTDGNRCNIRAGVDGCGEAAVVTVVGSVQVARFFAVRAFAARA